MLGEDVLEFFNENCMTWTDVRFEVIFGKRSRRAVLCTADDSTIAVDENKQRHSASRSQRIAAPAV